MKFILTILCVFSIFAASANTQELTPLTKPAKPQYRSKNNPKGDCGALDLALDFNVKFDFPKTNGKVATEVVASTLYDKLLFEEESGNYVAKLYYFLRFAASEDHRIVGFIEADPIVRVTDLKLADVKKQSHLIRHRIDLPSGSYIADIILQDKQSGCRGAKTIRFVIPCQSFGKVALHSAEVYEVKPVLNNVTIPMNYQGSK